MIAERRYMILVIAGLLMLAGIASLIGFGLNFGIDFRGGTLMERAIEGEVSVEQVREVLAAPSLQQFNLGGSSIQPLEEPISGYSVLLIRTHALEDADSIARIDAALEEAFGEVVIRRTELVGPVIGEELVRNAVLALVLAGLGIAIYISVRFEYRFGIAALLSLVFNAMITLGLLALLGHEINSPFIAAILTVIAYSINDTIVIFDRIRENLQLRPQESLVELVNVSIRQSIVRSLNTSVTTLAVLFCLYFLGGSTLKDFTLTLIIGVAIGACSSIFIASPIWLILRESGDRKVTKAA